MLENRGFYLNALGRDVGVLPAEIGSGCYDEGGTDAFALCAFVLEQTKQAVNDEDAGYEVGHVERHALQSEGLRFSVVAGKERERVAVLVECHPEENHYGEHEAEANDAFLSLFFREFGGGGCRLVIAFRRLVFGGEHVLVRAARQVVNGNGDDEAHAGHGKRVMVRVGFACAEAGLRPFHNLNGGRRGEHRADIDGHVEKAEAAVALVGILGRVVEAAYHYLQVAFEQARAEAHEDKGQSHGDNCHVVAAHGNGEQQVADEHDEDARRHHLAETEAVGRDAADDRQEIHKHQECGINTAGKSRCEPEVGLQVKQEDGQHRVVAETFARVGKRKCP